MIAAWEPSTVDPLRAGRSLRALRIRRGLRQSDVAEAAHVSRSQVGRIERGELSTVRVGDVMAVCVVLGADLELRVRWHGEGLDRLLDAAHASLVDLVLALLSAAGWECAVEVSFGIGGERGSVDILARHPMTGAVLVVEVKSVIPDAQSMLTAHDRKVRLGRAIARSVGWEARSVSRVLVVADGSTSRDRVARLGTLFATAYPARAIEFRRWLRDPKGVIAALMFLRNARGTGRNEPSTGRERVRRPRRPPNAPV